MVGDVLLGALCVGVKAYLYIQEGAMLGRIVKPRISIASPCSADWNRMVGTESVGYCPECKLNVYNFLEMSSSEVDRIIAQREGRLCARYYQRTDGTMLTQNCPVGFRTVMRRVSILASAAMTALMSVGPVMAGPSLPRNSRQLIQIQQAQAGPALEVVDASGAVITRAWVIIVNEKTGVETMAQTDERGRLRIPDLPSGIYGLSVQVPGFATKNVSHLAIPVPEPLKLQLDVAVMGEVVEVRWEPESSPVSALLSEPVSGLLSEPAPVIPNDRNSPASHHNLFHKLFSGLRRVF